MPCDTDSLLAEASCFQCIPSGYMFDAIEIVILCAIRDGDTSIVCDPQTLLNQANCILCKFPPGMYYPVKLQLLCQISGQASPATFYILAETGAILNAENNDRLRKEQNT